ncbi:unnamed protein product [Rhizophagus irregularis]|nr:unnamed protein product [Rhizophagus irregularis]
MNDLIPKLISKDKNPKKGCSTATISRVEIVEGFEDASCDVGVIIVYNLDLQDDLTIVLKEKSNKRIYSNGNKSFIKAS